MSNSIESLYEKRIVAFIDILGFEALIKDSENNRNNQKKVNTALDIVYSIKEYFADDEYGTITGMKVMTFSDSIVISLPLDKKDALFLMLIHVIRLQLKLGFVGVVVRGGIAIGDLYHDNKKVFGPALIEAYKLESQIAIYPRVIIKENTLKQGIEKTIDKGLYGHLYDKADILGLIMIDDIESENQYVYSLDFLRFICGICDTETEEKLWKYEFRKFIVLNLNRYSISNTKSELLTAREKRIRRRKFDKYRWLLKYWNQVQQENADEFERFKINKRYPYK